MLQKKNKRMHLQADQEFQQNEIRKLNEKLSVDMYSTNMRDGKAFSAEQIICELKQSNNTSDANKNVSR